MKFDEDSILFPRNYCPSYCRPYMGYAVSSNGIFEYARLEKDFSFTMLCMQRPTVSVYRTEWRYGRDEGAPVENLIGRLENPCCFGEQIVDVMENMQGILKPRYQIKKSCATLGYLFSCCFLPFSVCEETFEIIDIGPKTKHHAAAIKKGSPTKEPKSLLNGKIVKKWSSCPKECLARGHHYHVTFPKNATVEQKTLIISAVMMLDMSYYDKQCCFQIPCLCL